MTIEQLTYALAVSQQGSFVKAAKQSYVTQPALTIQVKNLEKALGITLFDRTKKPILVTDEGKIFLEKAQEIILEIRDLQQIAQQLRKDFQGEVKLGMIMTLAPYLVPLFVKQLQELYSGIHLQVIELTTEEIIEGIKTGKLDAGIIATPVQAKGVLHEVLFYEKFYLYVSEKHPLYLRKEIKVGEVPTDDIWLLREGNCFRNQVNDICKIARDEPANLNFTYTSSSIESLKWIVEHQGGLTFVPELATLNVPEEKEDMIKTIAGPQPAREISIVTHRAVVKKKLIGKVKEILLANIPVHLKEVTDRMIINTHISV